MNPSKSKKPEVSFLKAFGKEFIGGLVVIGLSLGLVYAFSGPTYNPGTTGAGTMPSLADLYDLANAGDINPTDDKQVMPSSVPGVKAGRNLREIWNSINTMRNALIDNKAYLPNGITILGINNSGVFTKGQNLAISTNLTPQYDPTDTTSDKRNPSFADLRDLISSNDTSPFDDRILTPPPVGENPYPSLNELWSSLKGEWDKVNSYKSYLPNGVKIAGITGAGTFSWVSGGWGACSASPYWGSFGSCSATCGGGTQYRTCYGTYGSQYRSVYCRNNVTGTSVSSSLCSGSAPATSQSCYSSCSGSSSQSCNTQECPWDCRYQYSAPWGSETYWGYRANTNSSCSSSKYWNGTRMAYNSCSFDGIMGDGTYQYKRGAFVSAEYIVDNYQICRRKY